MPCYCYVILSCSFIITVTVNASNEEQICVRQPINEAPESDIVLGDCYHFSTFLSTKVIVDKTLLIAKFAKNLPLMQGVNLLTFSRRFGKTINLIMLSFFYGLELYKNRTIVPQHLTRSYNFFNAGIVLDENYEKIGEYKPIPLISNPSHSWTIRTHLAQYPVIFVEFKGLTLGTSFEIFLEKFQQKICKCYEAHTYLVDDYYEKLASGSLTEKSKAEEDLETFKKVSASTSAKNLGTSITSLSKLLKQKFSKNVVIFIDEYDTIFNLLYIYGRNFPEPSLQTAIHDFYVSFLRDSLITNSHHFSQAFLTGILKIKDAEIFSSMNFFEFYDIFSPDVNKFYGISVNEATLLLNTFEILPQHQRAVEEFYDGYRYPAAGKN